MTQRRPLRTGPPLDAGEPRWAAAWQTERAAVLPWLLLPPGVAARGPVLVTPYARRRHGAGLTAVEAAAVTAMQDGLAHLASAPPVACWIDASGRTTRLGPVGAGWLARWLHDRVAVTVDVASAV